MFNRRRHNRSRFWGRSDEEPKKLGAEPNKEFFDSILKKVLEKAEKTKELKQNGTDTVYIPWIYDKYFCSYEPFVEGRHEALSDIDKEKLHKYLSDDETIVYHFISIREEPEMNFEHIFFTNKQMIFSAPTNGDEGCELIRHLEFMPYAAISFRGIVAMVEARPEKTYAMEIMTSDQINRFIDYMTEEQAAEVSRFIEDHRYGWNN
ncbi:MAG: hypothetical protein IKT39_05025 [Clostridia bacterium]|nr:hypothetical protein [Clostridia bacterium]MBR6523952.1 hypothetical protein [Clostridia bacterium]